MFCGITSKIAGPLGRVKKNPIKLFIGGSFTTYNGTSINRIARLNSNGSLNSSFSVGTGFNSNVNSMAIQSDGKIVCGGSFTTYNGISRSGIARLNADGSLDSSFSVGTGFTIIGTTVNSIAIQSDGTIVCGGAFTTYNGTSINRIARLNSNGSLDSSFSVGTGFNGSVNSMAIQSDGKIVCGGSFTTYNGTGRSKIIRLNADGSLDSSFSVGTGFPSLGGNVNFIAIQSDGKIVCGGGFTTYNGTSINRIARLNSNGSLDSSFSVGTGFNNNNVNFIAIQSDGKIVCGGSFTSYNGTSINRITRLNSNGSLDSSFSVGTGFNNTVNSIAIQSDGKIVCGGSFTTYNGISRSGIARLNADGSLDSSFSVGTGFNFINSIAILIN